jgi:hypothetical protein
MTGGGHVSKRSFPGTSCQARHEQAIARRMATIALSLRDKCHSQMGSLTKLALMAGTPRALRESDVG